MSKIYDVIIIGGGASGLMCAAVLNYRDPSLKVLLIEKNSKAGRKLLATGNGRCNFTNRCIDITKYNTDDKEKLASILQEYDSEMMIRFFEKQLGVVASYKDSLVYPITYQSKTVADALVMACKNTTFIYETEVVSVTKKGMEYCINGEYLGVNVVFACGGVSLPDSGSNGSIYPVLMNLAGRNSFERLLPSLVPLRSGDPGIKKLAGIRQECAVTLAGHVEKGEILFTDYGVSGICVMQLSGIYNRAVASGEKIPYLSVDLIPSMNEAAKRQKIEELLKSFPDRSLSDALSGLLKKPLADIVVERSDKTVEGIAKTAGDFRICLAGSLGFDNAQITSGGLKLKCVNKDLELLNSKGIYVCGEVLNADGICGGYNLHFAWATAMKAADAITDDSEVL